MSSYLTRSEIEQGFALMGVAPIERDIRQVRDLMAPKGERGTSGVSYRTVITNGTGKMTLGERRDAELERYAD